MSRIGIFSGTFDPVHAGHIAFALKAIEHAELDKVVFIPETLPRRKEGVTHYAHRLAMLKLATKPYKKLEVIELPDKQFSVQKTLPRLKKLYAHNELFMLLGSDMVDVLISPQAQEQWPDFGQFLASFRLIVAIRGKRAKEEYRQKLDLLSPRSFVITSERPLVSSQKIREELMRGNTSKDVLPSLQKYMKQHWLYASVPAELNNS